MRSKGMIMSSSIAKLPNSHMLHATQNHTSSSADFIRAFSPTQQHRQLTPGNATNNRHIKVGPRTSIRAAATNSNWSLTVQDDADKAYFKEVYVGNRPELSMSAPNDFFQLLGVEMEAEAPEIRLAYRSLQRIVHPDIAGDSAGELAVLLNAAYATLMDETCRLAYIEGVKRYRREVGAYDGRTVSRWLGPEDEQRAIFVDETLCIGCRNCTHYAPDTFHMEEDWGRARVHSQWGDDSVVIRDAIQSCPVDCIHYVKRSQLALLEYIMKGCKREDVAIVMRRRSGNMGSAPGSQSPFIRAQVFLKYRSEARVALDERAAGRIMAAQDEKLAAAIARAWLALPEVVREAGWPSWPM